MKASDVKELLRLKQWSQAKLAASQMVSDRTVRNWIKRGTSRKGDSKRLMRLLNQARNASN